MLGATASRAYTDFSQFAQLRRDAQQSPQESLREVAKQFESIFINMMLKSMRDASFGDPLFDSNQSEFYQEMFDKQIALDMSKDKGIGLADALVKQMQKYIPQSKTASSDTNTVALDPFIGNRDRTSFNSKEDFIETMMPYAESAAEQLGVDPRVLVAQAALETGWGKAVGKRADGVTSFNLFNIKAQSGYKGNSYNKQTVEYKEGIAKQENASFRAYNSYQQSFYDYVQFIKTNSRYGNALANAADAQQYINNIQSAGYATDPHYASKVSQIMRSIEHDEALSANENV